MAKKKVGTVKWFSNEKGYGFISREDGGDVFFHSSDWCLEGQVPEQGMRVEFQVEQRPRGPAAFYVRREGADAEEKARLERAQELYTRVQELKKVVREEYGTFRRRVRATVLAQQEPLREPRREECPECGAEVTSQPAGMGRKYECPNPACDWEYFKRETTRLQQTYHSASPDGRRPAGYSERVVQEDISTGIPPVEIPAQENAASKLSGNRWKSVFPALNWGYLQPPPKDIWVLDRWVEKAQRMVEELEGFPAPEEIPEDLSPEKLLEWATNFPE